jgi:hypothetical protein
MPLRRRDRDLATPGLTTLAHINRPEDIDFSQTQPKPGGSVTLDYFTNSNTIIHPKMQSAAETRGACFLWRQALPTNKGEIP